MFSHTAAFLLFIGVCYGYKDHAPDSVCGTMHPNHDGAVSMNLATFPTKYRVTVDKPCYAAGDTVTVSIANTTDTFFEGFMVQARKKGDDKASYGKFQKVDNFEYNAYINIMNCLGGSMNAIGHNNSRHHTELKFQWVAPTSGLEGDIFITYTIVEHKPEFWVKLETMIRDCNSADALAQMSFASLLLSVTTALFLQKFFA